MSQRAASERFLDAYNAIDRLLRDRAGVGREISFAGVVERVARSDRAVVRYATDLKEYGDLRNAIVHESLGGQPIAEPHFETVAKLESILEKLKDPPKISPRFNVRVVACEATEPVGRAAKAMLDGAFSQLPVYEDGAFRELLTAETIARWLGDKLASGEELVEEVSISAVLPYTEDPEHFVFLSRVATVFDALSSFDDFALRGKSLDAILITNSGASNEKLLGIITTYDIPRLHAAVDVRLDRVGHEGLASETTGAMTPARTYLLPIADRDALAWIVADQRTAFGENRARDTRALEVGDVLLLYTTRGCFRNPTRDRGRVIGVASVAGPVHELGEPLRFSHRAFPIGLDLEIEVLLPRGAGVELAPLVRKMPSTFPKPKAWSAVLRRALAPLADRDAKLLLTELEVPHRSRPVGAPERFVDSLLVGALVSPMCPQKGPR